MTPRDLYNLLLTYSENDDDIVPIIVYGIIERAKYRWIESKERASTTPSDAEVGEWLAHYDLDEAFSRAQDALAMFSSSRKPQDRTALKRTSKGNVIRNAKRKQRKA